MKSLIKFINAICDDIDSGIEVEITEKELSELTPEVSLRNVLDILLNRPQRIITHDNSIFCLAGAKIVKIF